MLKGSIAVINQHGGVGKTTTTVNLGHALALKGHRVLLLDMDPQGDMAAALGIFRPPRRGMDEVLLEGASLADMMISTRELIDLVPAGQRLGELEGQEAIPESGNLLKQAINNQELPVDYIIVDCPPSAGLLVVNSILAVDDVLVPVAGDYLSLTGLARLMLTLRKLSDLRSKPMRKWIFMSRYAPRRRLSREVQDKILEHFPRYLLASTIDESAVITESAAAGRTVFEYKPTSRAADEFTQLSQDWVEQRTLHNEREQQEQERTSTEVV